MKRIVSGAQPTGNLHIGNYLGAIKNWVSLQKSSRYELYIFVADLHSLSGKMAPDERREQIMVTAAELLAAGIDPEKTTLFVQSFVPEHTELAWIFNCLTPMSELERMTQYKDKIAQFKQATAGLFTYPVLQAADILLYHGDAVPVGQDQVQHVELTRDTARWFNNAFGEYFKETEHILTKVPKVMSLLEPTKKMSKSLGQGHVIELADEPDVIMGKIKKAVTAATGGEKAPGVANLFTLLKEFADKDVYEKFAAAEKDGSIRYGELKETLGTIIADHFSDFRAKRADYLANREELEQILTAGAAKAHAVAEQTMTDVRKLVGLR